VADTKPFLPYARQYIDADDVKAVEAVLKSDFLTTGPMVERYETAFAKTVGSQHAVACNSGTAALHLALMALGIGPGARVLVPAITFAATANVALYQGGDVEFIDTCPDTGLMDMDALERRLENGPDVDVVMPVYLAGQCEDPGRLWQLSQRYGFKVVEDACHATGTTYGPENTPVGATQHAHLSCFSTHAVKTVATGEGGMITGADKTLMQRVKTLRSHGITRDADLFLNRDLAFDDNGHANPWYYEMQQLGYNYRLPDINCALGISQLGKLAFFRQRRRRIAAIYDQAFADFPNYIKPLRHVKDCNPVWHLYVILIDFKRMGIPRARVMAELKNRGIGTQVHYIPVPYQPFYRNHHNPDSFPGADEYYNKTLSLPLFPGMSADDAGRVIQALRDVLI